MYAEGLLFLTLCSVGEEKDERNKIRRKKMRAEDKKKKNIFLFDWIENKRKEKEKR